MLRLYHWPLDPASRTVRLVLGEKKHVFEERMVEPWAKEPEILQLAPGARLPAMIDRRAGNPIVTIGSHAIIEHLEETPGETRLLPSAQNERAEARRMWRWSEDAFDMVNTQLLSERVSIWAKRHHTPSSQALREGAHTLRGRLTFLNGLIETRENLAGRHFSIADLAAAAHLSCYDYFGDVPWEGVPDLKLWYSRVKSRPSFRPLLEDQLLGLEPASHYMDLDF